MAANPERRRQRRSGRAACRPAHASGLIGRLVGAGLSRADRVDLRPRLARDRLRSGVRRACGRHAGPAEAAPAAGRRSWRSTRTIRRSAPSSRRRATHISPATTRRSIRPFSAPALVGRRRGRRSARGQDAGRQGRCRARTPTSGRQQLGAAASERPCRRRQLSARPQRQAPAQLRPFMIFGELVGTPETRDATGDWIFANYDEAGERQRHLHHAAACRACSTANAAAEAATRIEKTLGPKVMKAEYRACSSISACWSASAIAACSSRPRRRRSRRRSRGK